MTTFPIADWRLDGRHRVLVASLATQWKVRARPKPKPAYDREAMHADYRRDPMFDGGVTSFARTYAGSTIERGGDLCLPAPGVLPGVPGVACAATGGSDAHGERAHCSYVVHMGESYGRFEAPHSVLSF